MVPIVYFQRSSPRVPASRVRCGQLRREVIAGQTPLARLRALLELPRALEGAPGAWWWLMREDARPLVDAALQLSRAFPHFGSVRVVHAELELLQAWFHGSAGWRPHESPLGGPTRGLCRALARLRIDPAHAEEQLQVLQRFTFDKGPRAQARWLEFLSCRLGLDDRRRVRALAGADRCAAEATLHAERLRELALEFARLHRDGAVR